MRARLVTALVVLSLGLAGCSVEEEPEVGPGLPPITESPSPSPDAAAVPTEATEATPEGAAEFAKFFVQEVNQAYLTLDADRVKRFSAPTCETCQQYIETINEIKARSATVVESYVVEVLDAAAPTEEPGATRTSVTASLRIGEFVVLGSDGSELLREPANEQAIQQLELERRGDSWITAEVIPQ